jgi:hypothetical protein
MLCGARGARITGGTHKPPDRQGLRLIDRVRRGLAADQKPRPHADAPGQQGLPGADQGHADRKSPRAWLRRDLAGAQVLDGEHGGAGEGRRACQGTSANPARTAQTITRGSKAVLGGQMRGWTRWCRAGGEILPGLGRQPYDSSGSGLGLGLDRPGRLGAQSSGSAAEPPAQSGLRPAHGAPRRSVRIARSQALTMPRALSCPGVGRTRQELLRAPKKSGRHGEPTGMPGCSCKTVRVHRYWATDVDSMGEATSARAVAGGRLGTPKIARRRAGYA